MTRIKASHNKLKTSPIVFVGLSGGVDSSVSAALLKQQGFNVTGVFIKVWTPDFLPCTWREDRRDAMRVCAHLDIPFVTLDLESVYKKEVVDYMVDEYKAGKTPNPDVMCNKEIKFGAFYDFAMSNGADFVATGHYAQKIEHIENKTDRHFELKEGKDKSKDQSYFIWNIKIEQLPYVLFPIGGIQKSEVRKLALKFKLPTAEKKDSQGLCFLGKVDMKDFLKHFIKPKKGNVLDTNDKKIGTHDGVMFLTVGQRHGFSIVNKRAKSEPMYIVSKNAKNNSVTVSSLKPNSDNQTGVEVCSIYKSNWLSIPVENKDYNIRFRYHQVPIIGKINKNNGHWQICLNKITEGISAGQSAVVYDKETLIGGGVIQ